MYFSILKTTAQKKHRVLQAVTSPVNRGGLAFRSPDPFPGKETLQRKIAIGRHLEDGDKKAAETYETALDNSVDTAYKHMLQAPDLKNHNDVDGYIGHWNKVWDNVRTTQKIPKNFAAAFGYAVESMSTKVIPTAIPDGYEIFLQGERGGTRPDVVLVKNKKDIAWYDITASKSETHIDKKKGDWGNMPHVSEITYPSVTENEIQIMLQNKDNTTAEGFDESEMLLMREAGNFYVNLQEKRIKEISSALLSPCSQILFNSKKKDRDMLNPKLNYHAPLLQYLNFYFKLGITDIPVSDKTKKIITDDDVTDSTEVAKLRSDAPGILLALGIDPAEHGFVGSAKKSGKDWLIRNDNAMPKFNDILKFIRSIKTGTDLQTKPKEKPESKLEKRELENGEEQDKIKKKKD